MASSPRGFFRELLETVLIALVLSQVLRVFIVETIVVDGRSMEPTLHNGERLLINKFIYRFRLPQTGDIIAFRYPYDPRRDFIKRVIAHQGQTVEIRQGRVYIDGVPRDEPYIANAGRSDYPLTRIHQGAIFVLGDNRPDSEDSRFPEVGQVPLANIKGVVFARSWPLRRLAWLSR